MSFLDSIKNIFNKDVCDEFPDIEESMEIVSYYGTVMCSSDKQYTEDLDFKKYQIRRAFVHVLIKVSSQNRFWDEYVRDSEVKYSLSTRHKSPCSMYFSIREGLSHLSFMRSKEGRGSWVGESDRCKKFLDEFQRKSRIVDAQIQEDDDEIEMTIPVNEMLHERIMMDFVKPFLKSEYSHDN